jgi:UDP-glucose 4-epimerase
MRLEGKRVIVTGAKGFVGSHLCAELLRQGAEVVPLDVKAGDAIDIREWPQVRDLGTRLGNVDLVFHLAALMFVPYSFESPRETYEVNILGTLNILELCRLANIDKLVFASSYVYGNAQYLPIDEEHPLRPTNPYAKSKVMGENLCKAYHDDYGLKCIILRPFNIYGEGQSESFLIPSVLRQILSGRIELMDPKPRRDFLYISDAIEAYVKAGQYDGSDFDIFNIGSGKSHSVEWVVTRIVQAWGQPLEVDYKNRTRKTEIMNTVANIEKAKNRLGWEPKVSIQDGIKRCVEWHTLNVK